MNKSYLEIVRQFYDAVLKNGLGAFDTNRAIDTPIFPNALVVDGHDGPRPFAEYTGEIYANMALQGSLCRGLSSLSRLTGEGKYQQAAEESLRFLLSRYQSPHTGLLPWGGHVALDLASGLPSTMDDPGVWARHELKAHQPPLDLMWSVNSAATTKFIEGFWREHVRDDSSYMFSRHGDLFGITSARSSENRVRGGDGCQFMTSALDLASAAAFLWKQTGRSSWLNHAQGIIRNFDETRNPQTGLGATSFTLGKRAPVLERHCLGRFTKCAAIGLRLGERLGDQGELFIQTAHKDLLAFGRLAYDEKENGFFIRRWLTDGSRIDRVGKAPIEISAYGWRGIHDTRNPGLPSLLYSFALAWRLTREPELRGTIDKILAHLGPGDDFDFAIQGSEAAAYMVQGFLELWEADGDKRWLELAQNVAETAIRRFVSGEGFFFDWLDSSLCRLGQRLPLALLRLHATREGTPQMVEVDPGGGTYLDPNPKIRWRFDRHTYRIRSSKLDCVVGDRYPHGGAADGQWDRAGVHSLKHTQDSRNVFAEGWGGFVFEPLADVHPNCNPVLLSPRAVLLESAKELPGKKGTEIPTLVEAVYSLADDEVLDLDLRLQPLLVQGEDELAVSCDSVFAPDATVRVVPEWPAVTVRAGSLWLLLAAQRVCSARVELSEPNRVQFHWRVPAITGENVFLRIRLLVSSVRFDPEVACREFESSPRPDIQRLRRQAIATAQMATST